jgi:feruloyl esterase
MSFMTPPNPSDLSVLRDRGAKLIVYHGTSDPVFSSNDTAAWYSALQANQGGNAANFARYFPVPGMNHCSGGVTTDKFDALSAIVNWVENGQAPDRIVASARADNTDIASLGWSATRSRPLCVAPKVARYKGGDIESATSFACE